MPGNGIFEGELPRQGWGLGLGCAGCRAGSRAGAGDQVTQLCRMKPAFVQGRIQPGSGACALNPIDFRGTIPVL